MVATALATRYPPCGLCLAEGVLAVTIMVTVTIIVIVMATVTITIMVLVLVYTDLPIR